MKLPYDEIIHDVITARWIYLTMKLLTNLPHDEITDGEFIARWNYLNEITHDEFTSLWNYRWWNYLQWIYRTMKLPYDEITADEIT